MLKMLILLMCAPSKNKFNGLALISITLKRLTYPEEYSRKTVRSQHIKEKLTTKNNKLPSNRIIFSHSKWCNAFMLRSVTLCESKCAKAHFDHFLSFDAVSCSNTLANTKLHKEFFFYCWSNHLLMIRLIRLKRNDRNKREKKRNREKNCVCVFS